MQAQPHLIEPYARHELNLDLSIYEKITRLENLIQRGLENDIAYNCAFEKIARLENLIQQLECKVDELAKKIAFYESPNMASSTPSMYNTERINFRKTYGSPEQPAPQKQNDNDNTSSKSEEDAKKNASDDTSNTKHDGELPAGTSHSNKSTETIRYVLSSCPNMDVDININGHK